MDSKPFVLANGTILSPHDDKFILAVDDRPDLSQVSRSIQIPVIDLNETPASLVKKVAQACHEHGAFQIINHRVPKELSQRMITSAIGFFKLPSEERSHLLTDDPTSPLRVSHFHLKVKGENNDDDSDGDDKVTMWCETLAHPWHPTDDFAHLLPRNPPHYRELASEYAKEIGWLVRQLLSFISQGLGLNNDFLQKRLGDRPTLVAHATYYPPCPQPDLTLGSLTHTDINAITILLQSETVSGHQIIKNGQWIAVDPVPDAFVVTIGDQIEVLSNGRYRSVCHRAVANKDLERASIAMFYGPNKDSDISPIEDLVDGEHPRLYRNYQYQEFVDEFHRQQGRTKGRVKEVFQLHN